MGSPYGRFEHVFAWTCYVMSSFLMKKEDQSSEFHRLVQSEGWTKVMQAGSLVIYERNGRKVTVPYHGSAEMPKGLENKLRKKMGL